MNADAGRGVLARVAEEFGRVFASLEPIKQHFTAIAGRPESRTREDVAALRPEILGLLRRHRRFVAGAGVVAAPGLLGDAPHWLEWWWSPSSGEPGLLRVNLDPASPDFFDYPIADWFATPRDTAAPHISGPSVDHACTNEYAVTLAAPVSVGGAFAGVAAADVLSSSLEERVLPSLCELSPAAVLVTGNGRVVASASPDYAPGLRAGPVRGEQMTLPSRGCGAPAVALDWQLLEVPGAPGLR